ncbi:hypothetical protein F4859DRAFT_527301 [Xylaria cf. heliscus]|nr:hypothetical protein F4859DRAFT_527301 [Xylaria cf. heliscus]
MANLQDLDLPIALRRTARHCAPRVVSSPIPAIPKTPSKTRPKKRVRFSDPGPELSHYEKTSPLCSTGLTPMIKRSSLSGPSPKRRRGSAADAARRPASVGDVQQEDSADEADILSLPAAAENGGKRRVRRGRLSAETGTTQKKATRPRARKENSAITAKIEAEVQRLRAELANRDAEIERLHNETVVHDTERIIELEQQIEALRTELAQSQLPPLPGGGDDEDDDASDSDNEDDLPHSFYDWTLAPREPFSDISLDGDDDFQMTDVACSTPSRRRKSAEAARPKSASASFPTPPCTSPTLPATPFSERTVKPPVTPHSHAGIQASLPDPEKEALEAELVSLRLELIKLTATLDTHTELQARLSEKLASASSPSSTTKDGESGSLGLEEHLNSVLQKLSERTTALTELNSSLSSLGFGGTEPSEIIGEITSGLRTARLELEYITPGEITLPLSSHGAQVLDLVLTRLRDLARRTHEDEEAIDEYHALELSLRQQLNARVDAMDSLRAEQQKTVTELQERDAHIADLEIGLDRLKSAAEGYRRDIAELETLVQRIEGEGKARETELRAVLDTTEARLAERGGVVADLEAKLAATLAQADELGTKLKQQQRRREAEAKVRNQSAGAALALRDARVSELRREIYGINESLRAAHEAIVRLRLENAGLERRAQRAEEREQRAREAVDTVKAELEKVTAAAAAAAPRRVTRSSAREVMGLTTPEPQSGAFPSDDLARSGSGSGKGKGNGNGRKRRKYDSGLGLLDEDEDELQLVS